MGCREKYQFCAPGGKRCLPLTGLYAISTSPDNSPSLSPIQQAVFQLFWKIMWAGQLNFQLGFVGRENLVANEYLWDAGFGFWLSARLPNDHWHSEVRNFMNTSLAMMQRSALVFARPPAFDVGPGVSSLEHTITPQDVEIEKLCHKIKARSGSHMSFSVLSLFLTIALGLFLIVSNLMLPQTVAYWERTGKGLYK
jgi:hypothetical protein